MAKVYRDLQYADSIRLICLTKDCREGRDTVRVQVYHCRLDNKPKYAALSYTWGELVFSETIIRDDGVVFNVTSNLHNALLELATMTDVQRLWVDQICINQDDGDEKGRQVRLMSRIYGQAERVIAWIGQPTLESDRAMRWLFQEAKRRAPMREIKAEIDGKGTISAKGRALLEVEVSRVMVGVDELLKGQGPVAAFLDPASDSSGSVPEQNSDSTHEIEKISTDQHGSYLEDLDDVLDSSMPRTEVYELINRPWFSRLWIVQEVLLATKIQIQCGQKCIDFDELADVAATRIRPIQFSGRSRIEQPWTNIHRLGVSRRSFKATRIKCLAATAHDFIGWDCKYDLDRLNALYGACFLQDETWWEPSYKMNVPELYEDFARKCIKHKRNLDILHYAGNYQISPLEHTAPTEVASWAPDWRMRLRPLPVCSGVNDFTAGWSGNTHEDENEDVEFDAQGRLMTVKGKRLDIITKTGSTMFEYDLVTGRATNMYAIFSHWYDLVKEHCSKRYGDCLTHAFAQTLVMGGRTGAANGYEINDIEVAAHFLHWAYRHLSTFERPDWLSQQAFDEARVDATTWGRQESQIYDFQAIEVSRLRSLFVTKDGRMGLATGPSTEKLIYLIKGMRTPFMVDNDIQGTGFKLLSECFVHGEMDEAYGNSCAEEQMTFS